MAAHALLGPSAAKRWLTCTPSARLSETFEDKSSVYAAEGTAAHELAEYYLYANINGGDGATLAEIEGFKAGNEFYNGEMEESVNMFVDNVWGRFEEAKSRDPGAMILPEQKIDFSEYVPEGFGTGDVTILSDKILEIIDLKYGKGVAVDAHENPQLMLYGLGAWNMYKILYDIDIIRMTIIQPRLDSISTYEMKVEDLVKWAREYVTPKAKEAYAGTGSYKAGEHCRFCKAKIRCRTYSELNLEIAKHEFKKPQLLGITAMQSLLGKKKLEEILADLIIKAPGKPTLVLESDKRPEINSVESAKDDFKEDLLT